MKKLPEHQLHSSGLFFLAFHLSKQLQSSLVCIPDRSQKPKEKPGDVAHEEDKQERCEHALNFICIINYLDFFSLSSGLIFPHRRIRYRLESTFPSPTVHEEKKEICLSSERIEARRTALNCKIVSAFLIDLFFWAIKVFVWYRQHNMTRVLISRERMQKKIFVACIWFFFRPGWNCPRVPFVNDSKGRKISSENCAPGKYITQSGRQMSHIASAFLIDLFFEQGLRVTRCHIFLWVFRGAQVPFKKREIRWQYIPALAEGTATIPGSLFPQERRLQRTDRIARKPIINPEESTMALKQGFLGTAAALGKKLFHFPSLVIV